MRLHGSAEVGRARYSPRSSRAAASALRSHGSGSDGTTRRAHDSRHAPAEHVLRARRERRCSRWIAADRLANAPQGFQGERGRRDSSSGRATLPSCCQSNRLKLKLRAPRRAVTHRKPWRARRPRASRCRRPRERHGLPDPQPYPHCNPCGLGHATVVPRLKGTQLAKTTKNEAGALGLAPVARQFF